jgi:hypothetical protein
MTQPDLPEGIDPLGVPREGGGRQAFVLLLAVVVALLGLVFTLGWVVYHHLATSAG